jgi:hypothetical protein
MKPNLKYFLLLIFVSLSQFSWSQSVLLSPDNIDNNGFDYAKVIGQDEDGIYILMSNLSLETSRDRFGLKSRKYEISYFGYDLQPKWRKTIDAIPSSGSLESIGFFNEKPVIITSMQPRSSGEFQLYLSVLNAKGEYEVNGLKVYTHAVSKSAELAKPRLVISPNRRFLGVATEEAGNGNIQIHFCCINDSFKVSFQFKSEINYPAKNAELSEFALSNTEDLLFLAFTKDITESKKSRLRQYKIFHVNKQENKMTEYDFNRIDQYMNEAALVIDKVNNKAIITGFFSDQTSFAGASLLYATLPLGSKEGLKINSGKLNNEAQLKFIGQRNTGSGASLISYPIRNVIPRNDGGAIIIAEAAYLSEYSFYDYFTQTFNRRIEFHFDNILTLSINADGTVHWSQLIRKEQTSMDDEGLYSSFNTVLTPDELTIIYNNDIGRSNEITGNSIDPKGEMKSKRISKKSDSISILPRAGKQVDENTFVCPAVTKKRLFLVKFEV